MPETPQLSMAFGTCGKKLRHSSWPRVVTRIDLNGPFNMSCSQQDGYRVVHASLLPAKNANDALRSQILEPVQANTQTPTLKLTFHTISTQTAPQ